MTLAISTEQQALLQQEPAAPLTLVHLTTYSDYTLASVETEFWWSSGMPLRYPWAGGAVREFEDVITSIGAITRAMQHTPNSGVADLRRSAIDIELDNSDDYEPAQTAYMPLWNTLRQKNLHYSKVEIATLLIDPTLVGPPLGGDRVLPWDLTAMAGTEHHIRFRGELTSVGDVTNAAIPLQFESVEPNIDWPNCTVVAECDPRDLGKRYPIPVGTAKSVPCINRKVGWVTTLAEEINATQTGAALVTDARGMTGQSNFTIQIGAERMQVDYTDDGTLNIDIRGTGTTTGAPHKAGETIIEIPSSSVFVFSGVEAKALDALYVISPITGEKIRITTDFDTTLDDAVTDSGRTISTVEFDTTQFQALMDEIIAAASVSQQPNFSLSDNELVEAEATTKIEQPVGSPGYGIDCVVGANDATIYGASLGTYEKLIVEWPSGMGLDSNRDVYRWRIKLVYGRQSGNVSGDDDIYILVEPQGSISGFSNGANEIYFSVTGHDNPAWGKGAVSAWRTPSGGTKLSSLEGGAKELHCALLRRAAGGNWGSSQWFQIAWIGIQAELDPPALSRDDDVAIIGGSMGYGIQLLADVQGAQTGGTLHETVPDIAEWFIEVFCGLTGAADAATFATAETNLGSNKHSGVLNLLGESFSEVLASLGYEGRCNLIAHEAAGGTTYKALCAESDFEFPAASKTLDEYTDLTLTLRSSLEQATRFRAGYALRLGVTDRQITEDLFESIVRMDVDQNDASGKLATAALTAAEEKYGRRDAEPIDFMLCDDEATGEEVLAYYAHESIRSALRAGLSVPLSDGYDLELGDIIEFTPRGYPSAVKCRVTQTVYQLGEPRIGLNVEEVE